MKTSNLLWGIFGGLPGVAFPMLGRILLFPLDKGLSLMEGILRFFRRLPMSTWICGCPSWVQIVIYYGLFLLALFLLREKEAAGKTKKERRKRCGQAVFCIAAASVLLCVRIPSAFSLTMLDVGQGDCLVVRDGGKVFLSDGGSTNVKEVGKNRILPYLKHQGIREVDTVFVSHCDADHYNGIEEIVNRIGERKTTLRIRHLCMPDWMETTEDGMRLAGACRKAGIEVLYLAAGDTIRTKQTTFLVRHPFRDNGLDGNAGSLVLEVHYAGWSALLTGDLEGEGEENLLPYLEDIDCLKVSHHGSGHSTSEAFLEKTTPEVALISAPRKSMYNHPHPDTMARLEEAGAAIFATKDCGAVSVIVYREKVRIRTYRIATSDSTY